MSGRKDILMYKKKNFGSKGFQKKPYSTEFSLGEQRHDAGTPEPEKIDGYSDQMVKRVSRTAAQPIQLKLDPTNEATRAAQPYALIAGNNATADISYEGKENLSGNSVVQLQNGRLPKLKRIFDVIKARFELHYNFYNMSTAGVDSIEDYAGYSFEDAFATIKSNIMYELPYFQSTRKVLLRNETGADPNDIAAGDQNMMDGDASHRLQEMTLYQALLQNLAMIPNSYNEFMAMEDHLMNMEYEGNSPVLSATYGAFKRAAVKSLVESAADILKNLYFDTKWYGQWASLAFVPSRKSNSMRDPLIVATAKHELPGLTVKPVYGSDYGTHTFSVKTSDLLDTSLLRTGESYTVGGNTYINFATLCEMACRIVSPYNVLKGIRGGSFNFTSYVNNYIKVLQLIISASNLIGQKFDELTTMLNVAVRSGMCEWKQGTKFEITKDNKYQPKNNKFLADVIKCAVTHPATITWDSTTNGWQYQTLWDEYNGIPAFDKSNGGNIIPFSLISVTGTPSQGLFTRPNFFDMDTSHSRLVTALNDCAIVTLNRDGQEAAICSYHATGLGDDWLERLFPLLSTSAVWSYYIPQALIRDDSTAATQDNYNELTRLITRLFKIGRVGEIATTGTNPVTVKERFISPDLISTIDVQVSDFTREAIAYGKTSSPIKIVRAGSTPAIGFSGIR